MTGRARTNLKDLLPEELASFVAELGEPAYRARQLFHWLHGRGATGFDEMTDLPAALRARLAETASTGAATVARRLLDPRDGTVKYLLAMADGAAVETVAMRYRYGTTVCVSSQVGCRQGCIFCASTIGGKERDLSAGEMVEQVLAARRGAPEPARVNRVVVMGMGEPLENYDELVRFLRLLREPFGLAIGLRHVTVSTAGLVPRIDDLAREGLPVTLAVSLHAPTDPLRTKLMPINRRFGVQEVVEAALRYQQATGRRVTFEYALIADTNDDLGLARELGRLLAGTGAHVNLIPLNHVPGSPLIPSPPERIRAFRRELLALGVSATVRRQLGTSIEAACGQLRRRFLDGRPRVRRPEAALTAVRP
ncbi:MAG: 23S rRNA (adenine(2503)-C(2))-methyltransferase RlmN [Clostridia bacterium]|nr:23S rRNA (adenine(2503)-C(2))-methyltransferase RlmN [Clostridia bacterium]